MLFRSVGGPELSGLVPKDDVDSQSVDSNAMRPQGKPDMSGLQYIWLEALILEPDFRHTLSTQA